MRYKWRRVFLIWKFQHSCKMSSHCQLRLPKYSLRLFRAEEPLQCVDQPYFRSVFSFSPFSVYTTDRNNNSRHVSRYMLRCTLLYSQPTACCRVGYWQLRKTDLMTTKRDLINCLLPKSYALLESWNCAILSVTASLRHVVTSEIKFYSQVESLNTHQCYVCMLCVWLA